MLKYLKVWLVDQQDQHQQEEINAESQTLTQSYRIRIYILNKCTGNSYALVHTSVCEDHWLRVWGLNQSKLES